MDIIESPIEENESPTIINTEIKKEILYENEEELLNDDVQLKLEEKTSSSEEEEIEIKNDFFETMIMNDDNEIRDKAIIESNIFIIKNNPTLKYIIGEILKSMHLYHNKVLVNIPKSAQKFNNLYLMVERLLNLYESFRKNRISLVALKALIRALAIWLQDNQDDLTNDVKEKAKQYWKNIDSGNISLFLEIFKIDNEINKEEMVPLINDLIANKKYKDAAVYISTLKIHSCFDILSLISKFVNQDKIYEASLLIEEDINDKSHFIRELTTNKNASKGADFIKKYNMNPDDFPELHDRLMKNCIRYHANTEDWMRVEEKFSDIKIMLGFFVEDLIYKNELDIALSIIKRHDLVNLCFIKKPDILEALQPYLKYNHPNLEKFQYIENQILINDHYAPPEEILCGHPHGTYIRFQDFGLNPEKHITFVDDVASDVYKKAKSDLLNAKYVGIDSEFKLAYTKFIKGGIATLQLASPDHVYIFDVIILGEHIDFSNFVLDLFYSKNVIKIGHSLDSDLAKMKINMNFEGIDKSLILCNVVDIVALYKSIKPTTKYTGLAHICNDIIGKPLSKYFQISNWGRRPLKKFQLTYAAMDAYVLIQLYFKFMNLLNDKGEDISNYVEASSKEPKKRKLSDEETLLESTDQKDLFYKDDQVVTVIKKKTKIKTKSKKKSITKKSKDNESDNISSQRGEMFCDKDLFYLYNDPSKVKFLVDNMAYKLVKYLRNAGFDAEFMQEKNYKVLEELAKLEKRIILTTDKKFFERREGWPTYLLAQGGTIEQFQDVLDFFKLKVNEANVLSRCVKCNNIDLTLLDKEEAKKLLNWKNEKDYDNYSYFLQCKKCKQVYWEGSTWKNAKERFKKFVDKDDTKTKNEDQIVNLSDNNQDIATITTAISEVIISEKQVSVVTFKQNEDINDSKEKAGDEKMKFSPKMDENSNDAGMDKNIFLFD